MDAKMFEGHGFCDQRQQQRRGKHALTNNMETVRRKSEYLGQDTGIMLVLLHLFKYKTGHSDIFMLERTRRLAISYLLADMLREKKRREPPGKISETCKRQIVRG